jgi:hypothetical protein
MRRKHWHKRKAVFPITTDPFRIPESVSVTMEGDSKEGCLEPTSSVEEARKGGDDAMSVVTSASAETRRTSNVVRQVRKRRFF